MHAVMIDFRLKWSSYYCGGPKLANQNDWHRIEYSAYNARGNKYQPCYAKRQQQIRDDS
jgi:hypothetical protein